MDISELQRQQSQKRHPWEIVRLKIISRLIKKYALSHHHIFDIGSGDAFVLNGLCQKNIGELHTAVDTAFTEEVIEQLQKNNSCNIRYEKEIPSSVKEPADSILLLDVLEHCKDDASLLQSIKLPYINQQSTVFITVPAFQNLFSQHDRLLFHYRRYNITELKNICTKNGFEVIQSGYFFTSLLLIRCIQLFLEKLKLRKPTKSIDNWNSNNFITTLVCSTLWLDYKAGRFFSKAGIRLPGLSAYCICRPLPL